MPRPRPAGLATATAVLPAALLLLFLVAPVVWIAAAGGRGALHALAADRELQAALGVSLAGATVATILAALLGTPLAWLLARHAVPGRALVEGVLDLPLVLPHPVAGIALLLVLGRASPIGGALLEAGLRIVGTPAGTVAAMLFVAAPLYVGAARVAFAGVDEEHELVARTLGAGPWRAAWRVSLPLARRGLVAGAIACWARALSEFGAVVVLAYHPRTAAVLSWERFTAFGLAEALPVAAALALLALVPLVALRLVGRARGE